MFLCGDSFDFLMAWKVFSFFMEVKRKEKERGWRAATQIQFGMDAEGREKSRERVCSLRFREDEEKKKKSVFAFCSFPHPLHSVWFVRAIGVINLLLLFILARMLLNLAPIKVALLTHIECSSNTSDFLTEGEIVFRRSS